MFFDPLTTWLVTLLANSAILANEKIGSSSSLGKWEQECIIQNNRDLNDAIRCTKESMGCSEEAFERIRHHISFAAGRYPSNGSRQYIRIDLDNQEYIITVLEECAKKYSQKTEEASQKRAMEYKEALNAIKKQYNETLKQREEQKASDVRCIIWLVLVFFALLVIIGILVD